MEVGELQEKHAELLRVFGRAEGIIHEEYCERLKASVDVYNKRLETMSDVRDKMAG